MRSKDHYEPHNEGGSNSGDRRTRSSPPTPPHPPAHRLGLREPDFERPLYDLMATAYRLLTSHSHVCCHSRDGRLRGKEKPPLNCTLTGDRDLQLKLTDFKAIFTHRETIKFYILFKKYIFIRKSPLHALSRALVIVFRRPDRQHLTHSGLSWPPLTWRLAI